MSIREEDNGNEVIKSKSPETIDPKSISTKITLKVKSGPGEIIGITERDCTDGFIDFSGIQFSDPGEYIISVIPSSPDVEKTEFTINILPEEDVIPQDSDGVEEEEVTGDRPIIAQIDQPSINLPPIEYNIGSSDDSNQQTKEVIGFMPYLYYYGDQIPERDISSMTLYQDGMVPAVIVSFADSKDLVRSRPPLDDTKFEIFLTSGSPNIKSIHLKFKLKDHIEKKNKTYIFTGTLDMEDFYKISYKSYNGTSFETLRKISKELGLGFNSNIKNTNDKMKWKNTGKEYSSFIYDIIEHSYISDSSFMLGYIDNYWCFNYVDIEKEWNRDISNDVGINTRGASDLGGGLNDSDKITKLFLTNEMAFNSSNNFISSYVLSNNSTKRSLEDGHFTRIKYYDVNSKSFMEFDVDALTTESDEVISLKGAPQDKKDFKENYKTKYLGRFDLDNVHQNYKYSEIQNRRNLDNLVKINAELTLPNINYNLYKYQKIRVDIVNVKETVTNDKKLNERLSGEWLITDISYIWRRGKMSQIVKVSRKELNKKEEELDSTTEPDNTVNNSEINENPINTKPNSVYQVGEEYTVRGSKDGKLYTITIESLSENGKEVVAKIIKKNG